jgi:hypothetical protein
MTGYIHCPAILGTICSHSLDFFPNPLLPGNLKEARSAEPQCTLVHEDSSTEPTYKLPAAVGFGKKSIANPKILARL